MTMRGLPSISLPVTLPQLNDASHDGMLLFIQYAFMPNRLDYCGTDDHGALYDYLFQLKTTIPPPILLTA